MGDLRSVLIDLGFKVYEHDVVSITFGYIGDDGRTSLIAKWRSGVLCDTVSIKRVGGEFSKKLISMEAIENIYRELKRESKLEKLLK